MATKKESVNILGEVDTRAKFLEGAKASYKAVTTTFGPKGMVVALEKPFGRPVITRDGVTAARAVFFSDRSKNMGAQFLMEASETTNRIAGDGTTATVALSYHLLKNSIQSIAAGNHPMDISATLKSDREKLLDKLEEIVKSVKKGQLKQVATVSAGDPLLGELISDTIEHVGDDGGIIAEKAPIDNVEREYVDGYYIQSGFTALQSGKREIVKPAVVVCIRPMKSAADAVELLTAVAALTVPQPEPGKPPIVPRMLLVGNIEEAAYAMIVDNINRGTIDAVVIRPPLSFGSMSKELLEDIAIYTHCVPITDMTNMRNFDESYIGSASKVVSTKSESTIFTDGETTEDIEIRVSELKEAIETEISDTVNEKLKDRIAKLEGKIALFRIGAPTDSEKEEIEFRVEDAINATRAASIHGVVPGGGITLLELSKLDLSDITKKALQSVFKQLLTNANLPAEVKLNEALNAPVGHGFNLREGSELVDVVEAGVIDPKLVAEQVIINSISVVSNIITVGTSIVFTDEKEE